MQVTTKEFQQHEFEELIEESDNWVSWDQIDKIRYTVLVSGASNIGTLLSHPFYVLTTRQQVQLSGDNIISNNHINQSLKKGLLESYSKIGLRGLFRGYIPLALLNTPSSLAYLGVTEYTRQSYRSTFTSFYPHCPNYLIDSSQAVFSAIFANFISVILYTPAEVISSIMVVQNVNNRQTMRQVSHSLYQTNGIQGFFRGFNSNFIYGVVSSSLWWWTYTVSRRWCSTFMTLDNDKKSSNNSTSEKSSEKKNSNNSNNNNNHFLMDSICGLNAGVVSTTLIHPIDTIRARIMAGCYDRSNEKIPSLYTGMKNIIQKEGHIALWRGLAPSVCATALSSMIFAFTYEFIKRTASLPDDMPDLG